MLYLGPDQEKKGGLLGAYLDYILVSVFLTSFTD